MNDQSLKIFLPVFLVAYFGVCFVWRSIVVWKRTGINPLVLGHSDSVYDYVGKLFKLTIAAAILAVLVFSFLGDFYSYLVPISYLEGSGTKWVGVALLLMSFVWTSIAQWQMRDSWRIGIDQANKTELVDRGLFRRSRNPIFLGMIATVAGFFLVTPNAVTLLVLCLGYVLIQIQVRLEEEHLLKLHGAAYTAFCQRVSRWL